MLLNNYFEVCLYGIKELAKQDLDLSQSSLKDCLFRASAP